MNNKAALVMLLIVIIAGVAMAQENRVSNASLAVGSVRSINTAQKYYAEHHPDRGYACDLTALGPPPSGQKESPDHAGLLTAELTNAESKAEELWLEERIGKITNGIAKLTIYGGSNGELKEAHDRCEDAVCAVRSAIGHGAVPGGCRLAIDMAMKLASELQVGDPARDVLVPALMSLPNKLLSNAGENPEEIEKVITQLVHDETLVYDIENERFGKAEELGLFDATKAVSESLSNAVSISCILGTMGGIVCHPRDDAFERAEARADSEYMKAVENPNQFTNEANERQ